MLTCGSARRQAELNTTVLLPLSSTVSGIDGFLEGEDARATCAIFRQLGVRIDTRQR